MEKPIKNFESQLGAIGHDLTRPTVIAYNRLETRARTSDFDRSLKAEIRDPLWMLARQWQFGEFQGAEAASMSTSRILFSHRPVNGVIIKDQPYAFDEAKMPLEAKIEREKFPVITRVNTKGEACSDFLLGAQIGFYFLGLLQKELEQYKREFIRLYPFNVDDDDPEATLLIHSLAGRVVDGCALYLGMQDGSFDDQISTNLILSADTQKLQALTPVMLTYVKAKFARLFTEPEEKASAAWAADKLEYEFKASTAPAMGAQLNLTAKRYHNGRLDWFALDAESAAAPGVKSPPIKDEWFEFVPAPVRFKGMPNSRFWEIDDQHFDLGKINTSATGILHLMLAEFGISYSNDWFLLPHPMPTNNICEIKGLMVTNVFGEDTLIRPAGKSKETEWHSWKMFDHSRETPIPGIGNVFYLVPAVGKLLSSPPIEQVCYIRDEMIGMAWAIEKIVPSQAGNGMTLTSSNQGPLVNVENPENADMIRYTLGNSAPSNWVPFVPVHMSPQSSEIKLQRAKMVTGTNRKGVLLTEIEKSYCINEEEIPRAGVIVSRSYQRCRWYNGKTVLWVGRQKQTGRGEGASGLLYDQVSRTTTV